MKYRIVLKDPDGVENAIQDAVLDSLRELGAMPEDEIDAVRELRREKIERDFAKWVRYGEYVTLVIDTDAGTCTVERELP